MPPQSANLILASQSPRRRQLLAEAGYKFEVIIPDESAEAGSLNREAPMDLVSRLSRQKAASVIHQVARGIIIGCDTVVECRGRILGKPRDRTHARAMLQKLRGRVHHVYSGLCLWRRPDDRTLVRVAVTKLRMDQRGDTEIDEYLDSGAWEGKAGGFGYQDRLGWIHVVAGSESNVVGLPLELFAEMLHELQRT
jgi:septum formation protein